MFGPSLFQRWPATLLVALAAMTGRCSCRSPEVSADDNRIIEASVQVNLANSGGSGVAIADHIIATNSHVVEHRHRTDLQIVDFHGNRFTGQTIAIDQAADVALVWCKGKRWPFVRMAASRPILGAPLRLFGYGPQRQLRWGKGRVLETWQRNGVAVIECSVSSVPGDSGGGLFNDAGELVALNWGGYTDSHYSTSTPAAYVRQVAEQWVVEALPRDRWQEYACIGGRCSAGPGENAGSARGVAPPKWPVVAPPSPPLDLHPPANPPQSPSVLQAPPTSPSSPVQPAIDADKVVSLLVERMATDERFRGPAGPQGPAGPAGRDGRPGDRGPAGAAGARGADGESPIIDRPFIEQIVSEQLAKQMPDIVAKSVEQVRGSVRVRVQPVKQ